VPLVPIDVDKLSTDAAIAPSCVETLDDAISFSLLTVLFVDGIGIGVVLWACDATVVELDGKAADTDDVVIVLVLVSNWTFTLFSSFNWFTNCLFTDASFAVIDVADDVVGVTRPAAEPVFCRLTWSL